MKHRFLISVFSIPLMLYSEQSPEDAFTYIYDNKIWECIGRGSASGYGSSEQNSMPYISFLEAFLKSHKIKSVVDVGCGDWTFSKLIHWDNIEYLGIDVVKKVVKKNNRKYQNNNIKFIHGDLLTTDFPSADLLICKDVLQHLTNKDIFLFLEKIKGKFKYCLITNDTITDQNSQISVNQEIDMRGSYRPVDLSLAPFNLKVKNVFNYPIEEFCQTKQVQLLTNK